MPHCAVGDFLQSGTGVAASMAAGAYLAYCLVAQPSHKKLHNKRGKKEEAHGNAKVVVGCLDLRRKAQMAYAKPIDHAGEVVVVPSQSFDISKTIFSSVEGVLPRLSVHNKLANVLFWSDEAVAYIDAAFSKVPPAPRHNQAIMEFVMEKCDFAVEHADGSFMDHLQFCFEYSFHYFKGHDPTSLLLHSIMGVGTNFFPMTVDQIPELKTLISPEVYVQIECFPTMLRLLYHQRMTEQMREMDVSKLRTLKSVKCHRVIDNAPIEIAADAFWTQLNFQLIHLLDFLPVASWARNADDGFMIAFTVLYDLLQRAGKLEARVDFDITEAESTAAGQPITLVSFINNCVPSSTKRKLFAKSIADFSKAIGHSLDFELCF